MRCYNRIPLGHGRETYCEKEQGHTPPCDYSTRHETAYALVKLWHARVHLIDSKHDTPGDLDALHILWAKTDEVSDEYRAQES